LAKEMPNIRDLSFFYSHKGAKGTKNTESTQLEKNPIMVGDVTLNALPIFKCDIHDPLN